GELRSLIKQYDELLHSNYELATEEQKARIGVLKAKAKVDDQISVEDKVAKLFEAIGGELDAESE
ncbi:terminase, partial [Anaerobutyricum hallii]